LLLLLLHHNQLCAIMWDICVFHYKRGRVLQKQKNKKVTTNMVFYLKHNLISFVT